MGGIIHAYYDCGTYCLHLSKYLVIFGQKVNIWWIIVSPYSFFAFTHLEKVRSVLASHGVSIEYVLCAKTFRLEETDLVYRTHPIFLGGIMNGSGTHYISTILPKCSKI